MRDACLDVLELGGGVAVGGVCLAAFDVVGNEFGDVIIEVEVLEFFDECVNVDRVESLGEV